MPATAGFVGTPGYVAPEHWRGDPASSAGDVWSLGMILYELFVGFHPYRGSGDRRVPPVTPGDEVCFSVPSGSPATELADAAVACLALEPEQRPSLSEVVQVLRRWLRRNDTVLVRPIRRAKLAAVAGSVVAAALLAGGLVWTLGAGGRSGSGRRGVPPGSASAPPREARPDAARGGEERGDAARWSGATKGTPPVAVVPRPDVARSTAADALETRRPAVRRAAPSVRRKRVRRAPRKKARRRPKKPEPINLDAPFPPR